MDASSHIALLAMAEFKYACFLSYRHGQGAIKQRFIEQFQLALSAELELFRGEKIFIDLERLKGGDFYNPALARAVFESASMVVVYHPNYFDALHPYCAREFRGMRNLETERLAGLPNAEDKNHGLIIPVVLRGEKSIPSELVSHRQYEDFSKFLLLDEDLSRHPQYAPKIKGIAEYIDQRCQCLEAAGIPFGDANNFQLPDENETRGWIRNLKLQGAVFP